ncbi:MAG: hypothetical protein ACSHYB_19635 [Roseibacillus sp.]
MKSVITIVSLILLQTAQSQIRWENLVKVEAKDEVLAPVADWKEQVRTNYGKQGYIVPEFSDAYELPFDSLKKLFPETRFIALSWAERPAPGKEDVMFGRALGLGVTLVFDSENKILKSLSHHGNYTAFGELMKISRVPLRNEGHGDLIWEAFCDIHQNQWKGRKALKIDERTWRLGMNEIEGTRYFYEVDLDESGLVVSSRLNSERAEQDAAPQIRPR